MLLGETLSLIIGLSSNSIWSIVLGPQIYLNYKNKKCDAVSFSLVVLLIVGDIFSILCADAKHAPAVIIWSGLYHIFLISGLLVQILYYRSYYIKLLKDDTTRPLLSIFEDTTEESIEQYNNWSLLNTLEQTSIICATIVLISTKVALTIFNEQVLINITGWTATLMFMLSRLPQIYLNWERQSVEGLALNSFLLINLANYLFLASILVNLIDIPYSSRYDFISDNLQWIIGSSVSSLFDLVLFYQFIAFSKRPHQNQLHRQSRDSPQ
jgi:uncharacterized protein with PQ loop repeat